MADINPTEEPVTQLADVRYIAGLGPVPDTDEFRYHVYAVVEQDGRRIDGPFPMIVDMTREQAEHLHLQLSGALGFTSPVKPGRKSEIEEGINGPEGA